MFKSVFFFFCQTETLEVVQVVVGEFICRASQTDLQLAAGRIALELVSRSQTDGNFYPNSAFLQLLKTQYLCHRFDQNIWQNPPHIQGIYFWCISCWSNSFVQRLSWNVAVGSGKERLWSLSDCFPAFPWHSWSYHLCLSQSYSQVSPVHQIVPLLIFKIPLFIFFISRSFQILQNGMRHTWKVLALSFFLVFLCLCL